jgi:hypothetical protein
MLSLGLAALRACWLRGARLTDASKGKGEGDITT